MQAIKRAYRAIYRSGLSLDEAKDKLREAAANEPAIVPLQQFIERSQRGIIR